MLRAFLNVCRHRGAQLCTESEGQVRRNIRCPYHAWTYALDGKLVAAPNIASLAGENGTGIDRYRYGLVPVALTEWLGYAWVCLADEPPSFADTVIGDVTNRLGDPAAIDRYGIEGLQVGHRVVYDVAANWKLIVENFMECYHCASIHPELVEVLPEFSKGLAAQYYVGPRRRIRFEGSRVHCRRRRQALTRYRVSRTNRTGAITRSRSSRRCSSIWCPTTSSFTGCTRWRPIAPSSNATGSTLRDVVSTGRDVSRSVELFHRVNEQDFDACERTQPAMSSRAYRHGGVLVPAEHHIAEFHRWVVSRVG